MFDAKRLLDQLIGGLGQQSGGQQTQQPWGQQPGGQQAGGQQPAQQGQQGGFGLGQLGDLAKGALGGSLGGSLGGVGGGALAGGLAAVLLGTKTGRKIGGAALQYGGMALLGGLAYKAYQDWQAGKAAPGSAAPGSVPLGSAPPGSAPASSGPWGAAPALPAPSGTPFNPAGEEEQQALGRGLLRAMIAAAKADGHIDATEQAQVFAAMDKLPLDAEGKAFVMDELRAPLDIDAVARAAHSPEQAAEIYTASLLAIDVDNPAERGYLAMLAQRLQLDEGLVAHLHATVEGAMAARQGSAV